LAQLALMVICTFVYWPGVWIFWEPGKLVARWLDLNSQQNGLFLVIANEGCFALAGFLVGMWLDDRARRRQLMKKHLRS